MSDQLSLLLEGLAVISAYMSVVFIISNVIRNAGIVDVAWASGFSLVSFFYLWRLPAAGPKGWLIVLMIVIWSLRLTWHLALRFKRLYPEEDARYTELKSKLGKFMGAKIYLIFLWQGTILAFLTAPAVVAAADRSQELGAPQFLALFIWCVGLIGESIADYQLSAFSRDSSNKGHTCQVGLWRYSRHPNYFFEWLGSVAFFLYASDSPFGMLTISCPAVLLHLLINVTGVKPAEEHSLKARSDYANYIKTTSAFIPWRRKH